MEGNSHESERFIKLNNIAYRLIMSSLSLLLAFPCLFLHNVSSVF